MIGACCPPEARAGALAKYLVEQQAVASLDDGLRVAELILKHFDLAPAGTLSPLVQEVARLARGQGYQS